jgi:hypothetical protein
MYVTYDAMYVTYELIPWFTTGLLTSSRTKAKLFTKKLKKPTDENIQKYKKNNNTFNTLQRKMKTLYYRQILEEN